MRGQAGRDEMERTELCRTKCVLLLPAGNRHWAARPRGLQCLAGAPQAKILADGMNEMAKPLPVSCTFQCLTNCPSPGVCIFDDPDVGEPVEYPEFFWWRLEHLAEVQKRQLMEPDSDCMILTPDCLDQFYLEPPGNVHRCRRCLSIDIVIGQDWIICRHCKYNEPLIDYPEGKATNSPTMCW